ncbi:hypothetical protein AMTRI_Chr08g165380 [Amborella trichopoda]
MASKRGMQHALAALLLLLFLCSLSPLATAARMTQEVINGRPTRQGSVFCPACVCCSPAPNGGCCRCCSSPSQTQSLQP